MEFIPTHIFYPQQPKNPLVRGGNFVHLCLNKIGCGDWIKRHTFKNRHTPFLMYAGNFLTLFSYESFLVTFFQKSNINSS